jgi:hypothetical protein
MKKISLWTFVFSTLAVGFVMASALLASWAYDDGTIHGDSKWMFLVNLFPLLRFPAHVVLGRLIFHPVIWLLGLVINSFLYGLLIERIISLFRKK